MTNRDAINLLEEVKILDDTMYAYNPKYLDALDMALNALEAEERKTGKWIRITQGAIPEKYMCPFCHRTVEHEGVEQLVSMIYPFCHCGARMEVD